MANIVLSNSGIGTLQTCPWMYRLKYELELEQMEKPIYYRVGSAFHAGVEAVRNGSQLKHAIKTAIEPLEDIDSKSVVTAMLYEWHANSVRFYEDYEVLEVEMKLEAPLAQYDGGEIYFAGVIDALLRDKQGRLFIGESKTTSDTMERYCSRLWAQRQGLLYNWALRRLGYDIAGIIYDVTRKPNIKRKLATPRDKWKYKKDGETLHSGQRKSDETQADYVARIKQWYVGKDDSVWQEIIVHSPAQLAAIEVDVGKILKALVFYRETDNWPRSLSACYAWNRACEFAPYCSSGNDELILSTLYKKRDRVFENLINRGEPNGESNPFS